MAPRDVVARSLDFARRRLGPASERVLASAAEQAPILSRIRAGAAPEDAVLAQVHGAACQDRAVADEFLAYFLGDLLRLGRPMISSGLRRFLDTGDLAQSVLGDLWTQLAEVRFESRAQFIGLLAKKISWKARDRVRGLQRKSRREDLRDPRPAEEHALPEERPSPVTEAVLSEERERMILCIMRLPQRDRLLLTLHLRGEPIEKLMQETGLAREAASKALQRARRRARRLAAADLSETVAEQLR